MRIRYHIFQVVGFGALWFAVVCLAGKFLGDIAHVAAHEGRPAGEEAMQWLFSVLLFPYTFVPSTWPPPFRVATIVLTALLWGAALYGLYRTVLARLRRRRDAAMRTA